MAVAAHTEALKAVESLLSQHADDYAPFGVPAPRSLLLSGPPGVGKTKAVNIAATARHLPVYSVIPGPDVLPRLVAAFKSARISNPSTRDNDDDGSHGGALPHMAIVFIDEVDAVCPASTNTSVMAPTSSTPAPSPAAALLAALLDPPPLSLPSSRSRSGKSVRDVFVIAATNRPAAIHASLRRPGRFDHHVALATPTVAQRTEILRQLLPSADAVVIDEVAQAAAGFVVADLTAAAAAARNLCSEASATREDGATACDRDVDAQHLRQRLQPCTSHLRAAFAATRPSVLRTNLSPQLVNTPWSAIVGMESVKRRLQMAVEWPLRHGTTFRRLGLRSARGILLHGPPGCSKTTLVRAAATASRVPFLRLTAADVYSCFLGDSERVLRDAFATARAAAPCVLFLDEVDAIVGKRPSDGRGIDAGNRVQQRVLSTLLTEMDGVQTAEGVLVVAATNRVDMLDDALLRPGRFDDVLQVGLPDFDTRERILRRYCEDMPMEGDVDFSQMARRTEEFSGADLKSMCADAAFAAMREFDGVVKDVNDISVGMHHFKV